MMYMIGMQAEEGIGEYGDPDRRRPDPISENDIRRIARQEALDTIEEQRLKQTLSDRGVSKLEDLWK